MFSKSVLKGERRQGCWNPEPSDIASVEWRRENGKHRSLGSYREQRPKSRGREIVGSEKVVPGNEGREASQG